MFFRSFPWRGIPGIVSRETFHEFLSLAIQLGATSFVSSRGHGEWGSSCTLVPGNIGPTKTDHYVPMYFIWTFILTGCVMYIN